MEIIVVTGSGFERSARLTLAALRRHHPADRITALVCAPRPLVPPGGFDRVMLARDLAPSGGVSFVDVVVGWGDAWARWWALAGHLAAEPADTPRLAVPDHAVVAGPLASLADLVPRSSIGFVARHSGARVGVATGGWVPEVVVVGESAVDVCVDWAAGRDLVLRSAEVDPWSSGPIGAEVIALDSATVAATLRSLPGVDPDAPWDAPAPDLPVGPLSAGERHRLVSARAEEILTIAGGDGSRWAADPIASIPERGELASRWRSELLDAIDHAGRRPPNPFVAGEAGAHLDWTLGGGDPEISGIGLVTDTVWASRPDLASALGPATGSGRSGFTRWLWSHGVSEGFITLPELPDPIPPRRRVSVVEHPPFGVNLVGYHRAQAGLGVAVRRVAQALDAAGINWVAVDNTRTASRRTAGELVTGDPLYRFNLMLMAPDQVPGFVDDVGPEFLANRYTIGLWYWETDRLNPAQERGLAYVDEIWGATDYLRRVFSGVSSVPVRRVPIPFTFPEPDRSDAARARIGLDDRFTFLFSFDFLSVAARKNPLGAVEAYRRAFPEVGNQRLILKAINGARFPEVRERLAWQIGDRPDIELWDRYLDAADRLSLVALSDAYVSLHRSEGLGLTMAEAMALGTPVIASRYSGNLDFSDDDSAWLVGGTEVMIGPGHHYPAAGHWFDPDLTEAARVMRHVATDAGANEAKVRAAQARIAEFSPSRCGAIVEARLRELWTSAARPLVS